MRRFLCGFRFNLLRLISYGVACILLVGILLHLDVHGIPFVAWGYVRETELLLPFKLVLSSLLISCIGLCMLGREKFYLGNQQETSGLYRRQALALLTQKTTETEKLNHWYAYYQTLNDKDRLAMWADYRREQY